MSITLKRYLFSIILICASLVSFLTQSHVGFQISIAIIGVPISLLFLLRLIFPEVTTFNETSNEYRYLSCKEKAGALLTVFLIIIWVISQIICLIK